VWQPAQGRSGILNKEQRQVIYNEMGLGKAEFFDWFNPNFDEKVGVDELDLCSPKG